MNGTWRDKMHNLTSLSVFAAQHHMHWVNLGLGACAQTDVDARRNQMHPSDLRTCNHLGRRVAAVTRQLNLGRAASSPAASSAPIH
jgi:hypothetical protein